ncbi:MAG: chemotaxis protein CheW [Hyphomicrobiaceae bacterium]|nr:chemotaxis protein CheW [Hyphomicrobiaceae bacterium]
MDDLLSEFLTETSESLDVIDVELVKFEQEPNNAGILDNIFRLVHTIKGTCGFLGLPRLEALAHAAETLMGNYRDGAPVTQEGVSLILQTIDRLKEILGDLEEAGTEPQGSDEDLISQLDAISAGGSAADAEAEAPAAEPGPAEQPAAETEAAAPDKGEPSAPGLSDDVAPPEPKEGEVSLDELERAFLDAPGPEDVDISPESAAAAAAEAAGDEEVAAAAEPEPAEQPAPEPDKAPEPSAAPAAQDEKAAQDAKVAPPAAPKDGPVKNQSIRVNVETLEHLMTMVSELVLTRNQLLEMVRRLDDSEFKVPLQRLSTVTAELQDGVMKTRMQPIGNAWQKLPRIVRDLAQELDKKIDLQMLGADTELDRQVLELIKDPLTHMVRNSADHGLESTQERIDVGKPEVGVVKLSAYHEGGHIIIEIADDGAGLNTEKVTAKIIENGLATPAELDQMSENQIHRFIFKAGFSTAAQVTSVSGRGVGMDVVRTNIELIGGTVDVKSESGVGSTFIIKIPLTLAIVSALIVESSGQRFAIPQLSVVELVRTHNNADHRIEMINDTPVLRLRNKLLPLITLSKLLDLQMAEDALPDAEDMPVIEQVTEPETPTEDKADASEPEAGTEDGEETKGNSDEDNLFVVVIQVGAQLFGIVVDSVFDTEEIVVKPMSSMLRDITLFSGNTILGDGSVIMIIDPNGIAQAVASESSSSTETAEEEEAAQQLSTDDTTTVLLFRAVSEEPKAVPLSLVTRLEELQVSDIERANGRDLVQYRGVLMPLVYFDEEAQRKEEGELPVLVFSDQDRSMGLVVDEIVDIVEDKLKIELKSESPGMIGSAVIKEKATEFVDIGYFIEQAYDDWMERREAGEEIRGARLLLVDDSAFFRNMLAPLLSAAGYSVTIADSAKQALELKDRGLNFDIIVSDIEMPEMDGIAFAEVLRNDPAWKETPIIALSSHTAPHVIERSRQAGFADFVGKFDRQGLMESIKDCSPQMGVAA